MEDIQVVPRTKKSRTRRSQERRQLRRMLKAIVSAPNQTFTIPALVGAYQAVGVEQIVRAIRRAIRFNRLITPVRETAKPNGKIVGYCYSPVGVNMEFAVREGEFKQGRVNRETLAREQLFAAFPDVPRLMLRRQNGEDIDFGGTAISAGSVPPQPSQSGGSV